MSLVRTRASSIAYEKAIVTVPFFMLTREIKICFFLCLLTHPFRYLRFGTRIILFFFNSVSVSVSVSVSG